MLQSSKVFAGFAVNDLAEAEHFYKDTLGMTATVNAMGMMLQLQGGGTVFVYAKPDHQPAGYTVLNFEVDDIDAAADKLIEAGINLEHYDMGEMKLDERGVFHSSDPQEGPSIAWFKDPAGNVLSILQA